MEPHPPRAPRRQADYRRSRSPADRRRSRSPADCRRSRSPATADIRDETGSPSPERRRTRDTSPAPRRMSPGQFMRKNGERLDSGPRAIVAKYEKYERRQKLDPMKRLRENGQELQDEILSDPDMSAVFEESRSARAGCRAKGDCLYAQAKIATGNTITTEYRIRVNGVKDPMFWRPTTFYYHVACFDQMIHLEDLMPTKFCLDPREPWGLLTRKWFEHKGCVNLDKIATHIEALKAYDEKHLDFSREWITWSLGHSRRCEADQATCACPPQPQPPKRPVLEDYTTREEERCSIADLMKHL